MDYNQNPYPTADHPLVVIGQAVFAFVLFALFFYVNRRSIPVRVSFGLLPFLVFFNLVARIRGAEYFLLSNVFMWFGFAACAIVALLDLRDSVKVIAMIAQKSTQPVVLPNFFDKVRPIVLWAVGLLIGGYVCYGYVASYVRGDRLSKSQGLAATQENTRVTAEYSRQQHEDGQVRDSILVLVDSLKKIQTDVIMTSLESLSAGQQNVLQNQEKMLRNQKKGSQPAPKTHSKEIKVDVTTKPQADEKINRPVESPKETPKVEPAKKDGFFKRLFGRGPVPDSLYQHVRADTSDFVLH